MKRPCLEIFIELSDEPNPALVKTVMSITRLVAEEVLTIGHPELKIESFSGDIDYHEAD